MLREGMKVKILVSVGGVLFSTCSSADSGHGKGVMIVTPRNMEFLETELRNGHAELLEVPEWRKPREIINILPDPQPAPGLSDVNTEPKLGRSKRRGSQ
jgi:hypothetical protein